MPEKIEELVRAALAAAQEAGDLSAFELDDCAIERPADTSHGEWTSTMALKSAKLAHCAPRKIAEAVFAKLMETKPDFIEKVELAGPGFLNITVSTDWLAARLAALSGTATLGIPQTGAGKRVVIDYSSPNAAKQMHIGHIRSTVIGNAIDRIYRALGYDVIADNHLGDWGTQFGKLIVAYRKWGSREAVEAGEIDELVALYVKFHAEAEKDDTCVAEIP